MICRFSLRLLSVKDIQRGKPMRRPSWASCFTKPYVFRVRFEKLHDGRELVTKVIVKSYDYDSARRKALLMVKDMFKDDKAILHAHYKADGYRIR